jgi:hypothetical protein
VPELYFGKAVQVTGGRQQQAVRQVLTFPVTPATQIPVVLVQIIAFQIPVAQVQITAHIAQPVVLAHHPMFITPENTMHAALQ